MTERNGSCGSFRIRVGTLPDAPAVAALHADSWRRHYRGAYSDHFLDHEVEADRAALWDARLASPDASTCTLVVEYGPNFPWKIVGFAHTIYDDDAIWGALLDNLHVAHDLKRGGVGSRLLSESARRLLERPHPTPLYLWVLGQNKPAQAFYRARGGTFAERRSRHPLPGEAIRCAWADPSVLVLP